MAIALEMMRMYGKALDNKPYQDLRQFVWQRVKEDPDTYPPVYPGDTYVCFLIGQMHYSKENNGRFHTRMPGITASIVDEIRDKVEMVGAEADDYMTLANIALILPRLEPTRTTKGISDNLERLTTRWMKEDPKTVEGYTGLRMAQALSCLQEEGDSPDFWQKMWRDEQHSHLWTTGFIGLVRVSRSKALEALPAAIQRSEETTWQPDSVAWVIYTNYLREDTGQGLLDFSSIVRDACLKYHLRTPVDLVFTARMISIVEQDKADKTQLEKLKQALIQ